MDAMTSMLSVLLAAFQWGYAPTRDDGIEFTIQLKPAEARRLAEGRAGPLVSYVPADARPVGRIRVVVGDGPLARTPLNATAQTQLPETVLHRVLSPIDNDQRYGVQIINSSNEGGGVDPAAVAQPASVRSDETAGPLAQISPDPFAPRRQDADGGLRLRLQQPPPLASAQDSTAASGGSSTENVQGPSFGNVQRPAEQHAQSAQPTSQSPPQVGSTGRNGDVNLAASTNNDQTSQGAAALSPSDEKNLTAQSGLSPSPIPDRPWMPFVGAIAVAFGFFAGNIFQWRSYASLRKRYLHLLRTTGG